MKQFKLFIVALSLAVIVGCAGQRLGTYEPDSKGEMRAKKEIRSRNNTPDDVRAQTEYVTTSGAVDLSTDTTLSPAERLTAAAIARGEGTTRALARVFHEAGISSPTIGSPATAIAPAPTEVQKNLLTAGFNWDRGQWFAPTSLDPARQSPLNEEEAVLIYKYKDASDQGPARALIDSIKGKYR